MKYLLASLVLITAVSSAPLNASAENYSIRNQSQSTTVKSVGDLDPCDIAPWMCE